MFELKSFWKRFFGRKKTILCVFGTRPEVIKMAPLISLLKKENRCRIKTLATAQHRQMLDQTLKVFSIRPDFDLDIMEADQSLAGLTAKLALPLERVITDVKPDLVLIQGDTTTAFLTSLICFYKKIPVGHIEAGLRTHELRNPFPEEMNRLLISRLASMHFCPTEKARDNLLRESVSKNDIFLTGNTVIDALQFVLERPAHPEPQLKPDKKLILVTAHRRGTFGHGIEQICRALLSLVRRNDNIQILFSVHPNPNIKKTVTKILGNQPRILLRNPFSYDQFVHLMKKSHLILSDSGGIQEEVSYLGIPTLIMRDTTERPEVVEMGIAKTIGVEEEKIVREAEMVLHDDQLYRSIKNKKGTPFGDGSASVKILQAIKAL